MEMDIQMIPDFPCPSPLRGQPAAVQNRSRRFCQCAAEALDECDCAGLCRGFCSASFLGQMRGNGATTLTTTWPGPSVMAGTMNRP